MSRPPSPTLLTNLPHSVPREAPPQLAPLLNHKLSSSRYGYIRNHMKTIKNEQARTRESEEYKKKPKNQSRSQKSQASVKSNMDSESAHMVAASKVPMLKPGEFEIWRMRIEQYIQMIDYALWEVIENGNSAPKQQL
ncbi:hypothetical protein Tco_0172822 [Tanacetum coccineum]